MPPPRLLPVFFSSVILVSPGLTAAGAPPAPSPRPDGQILRDMEARFARVVAAKDIEAFTRVWADDAAIFPPGGGLVSGPAKITEQWSPLLKDPGASLTWTPDKAEISASGDLGYTFGRYESAGQGPDGAPVHRTGYYLSIWRKGPDGIWRVVVDIGSPDPPPAPAPPAESKPTP